VPGELVTREQLQAELWPAQTEVEYEQGLNAAINRLREALGDSAAEPKYIETLPRRGYRFIGALESPPVAVPAPVEPALDAPAPPRTTAPHWLLAASLTGVVMLVGLIAGWWFSQKSPGLPSRLMPFTALAGEERAPAFSPDGTRVAFAWNGTPNSGGFDLFVKARGSEQLLRLTQLPARALASAWSPDGTQIAFARRADGATGVYVMPALGGAERRLADASFPSDAFMQLAWSPDGKRIAYSSYDGTGRNVVQFVDLATLTVTPLPDAPECWSAGLPAYSASGQRFAFVCTSSVGVYGIYLVEGDKPRLIATVMGEAQGMTFEHNDGGLIVANDSGDGGALWRVGFDGSRTRLPFGEEGMQPALARDVGRLAYVRARQSVEIWRMDLRATDVGASAQRLIGSTRSESMPQFSADGARIVFQSNRSGSAEIWMADAAGANPMRLTEFEGPMAGAPRWCADGRRIAFDSRADGIAAVYLLDVDARKPRRLGNADTPLALPVWSPDCRWILASDGRARLFRVSAATGMAEPFTARPSYYAQFAGTRVIFNVKEPDGVTLWSRDIEGGEESALPGAPKISYLDAWTVTSRGVYFTAPQRGATTVFLYDFATRVITAISALAKPPTPGGGLGISVSADDRWLLYTQNGDAQSDIMLVE
jgi:Tol biopolymer transport system component